MIFHMIHVGVGQARVNIDRLRAVLVMWNPFLWQGAHDGDCYIGKARLDFGAWDLKVAAIASVAFKRLDLH